MNRTKYILVSFVIIPGFLSAGCWVGGHTVHAPSAAAAQADPDAAAPRPLAVEIFIVQPDPVAAERLIPAVISVEGAAVVLARRDGTIVWLGGEEGAQVVKDQIIARLDDDESRAQLRQAELDVTRMKIEEQQCEAIVRVNQTEMERQNALFKEGLVSKRDLEQAQHQLAASREELKKTRLGTQIAQAKVQVARTEIERAMIRAPFTGMISRRHVKLGGSALRGDKLFEFSQLGPLEVRFQLPPTERGRIVSGDLLDLSLPEGERVVARARVRRIGPIVDAASNSLGYVADVVGDDALLPGLAVYVRLPRVETVATFWVPRAAFRSESNLVRGEACKLFVVGGNTCTERTVMVSAVEGDEVGVSAGLTAGDQVILSPPADLRVGDAVKSVDASRQSSDSIASPE